jgi:uncharacterized protein (DUF1330 family)
MSVYAVFIKEKTIDQSKLDVYANKIMDTFEKHPMKLHSAYGRVEVLEGDPVEGVVIMEFPTFEAAKAWYESPEYKKIIDLRFQGAKYKAFITQHDTLPPAQRK